MSHIRNLSSLYNSGDDPQIQKDNQTFTDSIDTFVTKRESKDTQRESSETLTQILIDYAKIIADSPHGTRELCYRYLLDVTQGTDETKQRLGKAEHFSRQQLIRLQFVELSIGQIDTKHHQKLLNEASLAPYSHFLERVRASAKHNLSNETEKAMTLLSKSAYGNRSDMLEDALKNQTRIMEIDGKGSEKSFEEIMSLTKHKNKKVRDQAAQNIHQITKDLSYIATREINSILEYKLANDTLRGYSRPDESRIVSEDISPEIIDALLQAVEETNEIARDFYELKAQLLGQDKLAYHERNLDVNLTREPEPTYNYDKSVDIVSEVFSSMDPEFAEIFANMQKEGRIDSHPRPGKHGGAFNIGLGQNVINLIMLNHTDTLNDVTTLAHEMGHAIHTQLAYQHQNSLSSDYGMLTAEVSSIFMEDYVYKQITSNLDETQQLELLMKQLNDSISTVHRQIACYRYEQAIHQEYRATGFVSTERLGELFTKHMSGYMGDTVTQDEGSQYRWVYWSHIRSFFYVFSYAGALILAKTLQTRVADGSLTYAQIKEGQYCHGRDISPQEIYANMNIDITDPQTRKDGLEKIREQLKEAQRLTKKLGY